MRNVHAGRAIRTPGQSARAQAASRVRPCHRKLSEQHRVMVAGPWTSGSIASNGFSMGIDAFARAASIAEPTAAHVERSPSASRGCRSVAKPRCRRRLGSVVEDHPNRAVGAQEEEAAGRHSASITTVGGASRPLVTVRPDVGHNRKLKSRATALKQAFSSNKHAGWFQGRATRTRHPKSGLRHETAYTPSRRHRGRASHFVPRPARRYSVRGNRR